MAINKGNKAEITFVAKDLTGKGISSVEAALNKLSGSTNRASIAQKELRDALKDSDKEAKDNITAFDELNKIAQEYAESTEKSVNVQKKFIKNLITIRDNTVQTSVKHTEMSAEIQKLTNSLSEFQRGGTKLTKVNGDMQSSTGLASGAVIEFGRGVSDAGFGITGVANNLQQFAAMFVSLRQETNGTKGAIQAMLGQFMGPLGILVAFQAAITLIEYLDRKFDLFGKKVDEVTKKLEEQKSEIDKNSAELRGYAMVLDDVNSSEESRKVAIEELTSALPNLTEEELNSKDALELTNMAIEEYIRNQSIRLEIDSLLDETQEKFSENREIRRIRELEGQEKIDAQLEFLEEKGIKKRQQIRVRAQKQLAEEEDTSVRRAANMLKRVPTSERVSLAFDSFANEVESEYKKTIARISELQGQLTDAAGGEEEEEEEDKKDPLEAFMNNLRDRAEEQRLKGDEQALLNLEREREIREARKLGAQEGGEEINEINRFYGDLALELLNNQSDAFKDRLDKDRADRYKLALKGFRERNKLERQEIKATEKMQLAKVKFIQSIGKSLLSIDKESKALRFLSFLIEKGAAIASVVVKAESSIAIQKANTSLANSAVKAKYAGVPGGVAPMKAEIAANNASLKKGIAKTKIGAAFSIATIIATSIKSASASASAGGGSADTGGSEASGSSPVVQPPDFNIVGQSETNQLAQTIADADEQPTRAYVVAEDVRTANELDRNIIEGASLG